MAVATTNVRVVRALMQWRRELNRSLEDELDFLDHRRDMFIERVASSNSGGGVFDEKSGGADYEEVDRFAKWISEERRRLVRVTELRCEECWRRAMTATDDKGRTPLHWAASGGKSRPACMVSLVTWCSSGTVIMNLSCQHRHRFQFLDGRGPSSVHPVPWS